MFKVKGKYNVANVYQKKALVEPSCIEQIQTLMNQEFVEGETVRIMPDCHTGVGVCIGYTQTLHSKKVCPSLVGVDIGCGVMVVELGKKIGSFEDLDAIIRKYVPVGTCIHEEPTCKIDFSVFRCGDKIANKDRILRSMGTLGGGNHFIEVDRDAENNFYLVIHSGSRNLGVQVANYYQNLAYEKALSSYNLNKAKDIASMIDSYKKEGREQEIPQKIKEMKALKPEIVKEYAYLEGSDFDDYINDMIECQEFAFGNRMQMADNILSHWLPEKGHWRYFETIHNYIDTVDMILRKGAVDAQADKLIIPINMAEGSLICSGKSNKNMNYSAPHGAGRLMSRNDAKKNISLEEFKTSMEGIYSTCVSSNTLDESPQAYKTIDDILPHIKNTVEIKKIIRPVYNFKA